MSQPSPPISPGTKAPPVFFSVRLGVPDDHAYVFDTWHRAHQASTNGEDHGPNFIVEQKHLIRRILARPTTELRIAADAEDSYAIHGYAVVEPAFGRARSIGGPPVALPRVYYVYVKGSSRRLGIAKALLADLLSMTAIYTHKPKRNLLHKKVMLDSYDKEGKKEFRIERVLPPPPKDWTYSYFANFEDKPLDETYGRKERG
jgi:GNAT superfamily N-acetyltransferase